MKTIRSMTDAFVNGAKSSTNFVKAPTLGLRTGGAGDAFGLILPAGIPNSSGAVIVSATLKVYSTATWSGSVTLTAKRVTGSWRASDVKYSNRPAVTATGAASTAKTGAVGGTEWALDVTSIAQAWVSGTANYGLRLEVDSSSFLRIHSAQASGASSSLRPVLEIVWSAPPDAPVSMNPDDDAQVSIARPTVTWVYSDISGDAMAGYQLQKNATDVWTSPSYDTGTVVTSVPQHTLTEDIADAETVFCRVRHQNAAGQWSDWSESFTFGRTNKAVLTLDSPDESPNDYVTEKTPPFLWSFAGTQTRFRLFRTPAGGSTVLDDSQVRSGTDSSYTFAQPLTFTAGSASVTLRVWDDVYRATTPGDPAYVEVTRTFSYTPGATVAVSDLVATATFPKPHVVLTWTRATAPDGFTILRDGVPVLTDADAGDLSTGGTGYEWTDLTASPGSEHEWTVIAVVNGIDSASPPSDVATVGSQYVWILDPADPDWWIALAGKDSGSWAMGEDSEMKRVRGSDRLVIVSEGLRGYEGGLSGGLYSDLPGLDDLTAQELRDRVWDIKSNPTKTWRLVLSDMNIPVVLREVTPMPSPGAEFAFGLSFEFYQQGELWWDN